MKHGFLKKAIIISLLFAIALMPALTGCTAHHKTHTKPSEQKFDDIKIWVERFEDPERAEWQEPDKVVKSLDLKPGYVVADIGAGTGYFTRLFARAVAPDGKALGLDTEPGMVEYMTEDARKLGLKNYEVRVVKTDDPELGPGTVDVVFICNTYHHIEAHANYLKNLSKVIKTGGRVVIVDFYDRPLPVGPQEEGHKVSEKTVIEEFRQAGFRLIRSHEFLRYQYFLEFGLWSPTDKPVVPSLHPTGANIPFQRTNSPTAKAVVLLVLG